jgi:DNA-binding PadR family transcriptional regulator
MSKRSVHISRRQILLSGAAAAAGVAFGGCNRLSAAPTFREFLAEAEGLSQAVQRALLWRGALAREYSRADLSPVFRANGSQDASSLPPEYRPGLAYLALAPLQWTAMAPPDRKLLTREILLAFWKVHILHHAAEHPVVGQWVLTELRHHGYDISPGTLYPLLKRMERNGWLRCEVEDGAGARGRRYYHLTRDGAAVLDILRENVVELHQEVIEEAKASSLDTRARRTTRASSGHQARTPPNKPAAADRPTVRTARARSGRRR